jgi:hypothetical protein
MTFSDYAATERSGTNRNGLSAALSGQDRHQFPSGLYI